MDTSLSTFVQYFVFSGFGEKALEIQSHQCGGGNIVNLAWILRDVGQPNMATLNRGRTHAHTQIYLFIYMYICIYIGMARLVGQNGHHKDK